jgi:predicted nuclease of restriction endonuclease-like (RecB) superfamily
MLNDDKFSGRSTMTTAELPGGYADLLIELKQAINTARVKAALSVNRELIALYWKIGSAIVQRQKAEGWGMSIVEQLSRDLRHEFPEMTGLSSRNIWRMRAFYLSWTDEIPPQPVAENEPAEKRSKLSRTAQAAFLPQPVAEIPWGHNIALIEKLKDPQLRLWYARQTVTNGWSRAVLVHQIETELHRRQGNAQTNFETTLPSSHSDLAIQILKDPYTFEFLGDFATGISERELEHQLIEHIRDFLLELGKGFAFVGSQYHLEVDGQDFYLDLPSSTRVMEKRSAQHRSPASGTGIGGGQIMKQLVAKFLWTAAYA